MHPYFDNLSRDGWLEEARSRFGLTLAQARRIFREVHGRGAPDWDAVEAPAWQIARVRAAYDLAPLPAVAESRPAEDGTIKYLLRLEDDRTVEAVYIPDDTRATLCISSQVGCAMACDFCFTGKMGLIRHLTPAEIVGQFKRVRREVEGIPGIPPLTNIVFMGMGEPLHNLDHVLAALSILTDDFGVGFPARRITVSTSGLLPAMQRLLAETTVRLALSLNGPNPEKRLAVMPVEKAWPIRDVLAWIREWSATRGNHHTVMFEYVMLGGLNDAAADADDLIRLLEGVPGRVNLIPFNAHPGSPYLRPDDAAVLAFHARLRAAGMHVFIRKSRGRDVLAACGQLHQENRRRARGESIFPLRQT